MCVGVRKEVLEVGLHVLGVTLCGFYSMLHSAPKVADEFRRVAADVWVSVAFLCPACTRLKSVLSGAEVREARPGLYDAQVSRLKMQC